MSVQFQHTTLDNGLTVIAEVKDSAHTAACGFFVKTGVRDEPVELLGVSHFLEHMMFKGTDQRTADQVNIGFDNIGANYNAATSQEATYFWAHVLPEYLDQAVDLLADILRPALRGEDFEMEKNVILEEIGMYRDRPFWVAYEQAMEKFCGEHPLGYRILGTPESIGALQRDQMAGYFSQRYSPDNMVVALSGRFDFQRTVDQINERCGHWRSTGAERDYTPVEAHDATETVAQAKLKRHYVVSLMPGPSRQDEARYAAAVLGNVLGDDDGSRLYWKLIDPGLADEAELSYQPLDRFGCYLAYASCDPARADEVEAALGEVLDTAADGLTDAEVERSRNKIAMDMMLHNEQPAGRMMALGAGWLYTGQYRPLEEELHRVEQVTADDLRQLVGDRPFRPRATVRLTPGE